MGSPSKGATVAVVLQPRAASGGGLQIWVGATGLTHVPGLRWFLDDRPVTPSVVREMESTRTPDMVADRTPRAFSGIFAFTDVAPGSTHQVAVQVDNGETAALRTRALPAGVPSGATETFNVMLGSCFHYEEDKEGAAGVLVAGLPPDHRPDLTLFAGDQVYLDLPTLTNFRGDLAWLAEKFEADYVRNWFDPRALSRVLQVAPSAAIPDDHEYWNNAPHPSPVVGESICPESRNNWLTAARRMFTAFQLSEPGGYDRMLELDVPPLSFFLMDNRTFREPDRSRTLSGSGLGQFRQWADRVARQGRYGVIVTGQTLFQGRASWWKARLADRNLADYGDYPEIMRTVLGLARAGRPVLCLTGDVHYGRVMSAVEDRTRARWYEVISSPTSLVTTVGKDQFAALENSVSSRFGRRDSAYRHRDAPDVPATFALRDLDGTVLRLQRRYPLAKEKGNHVALLRFRQAGFGVELTIHHLMTGTGRPVLDTRGTTITLRPTL